MPRRTPRERGYEQWFLPATVVPASIDRQQADSLRTALGRSPSEAFTKGYGYALGMYAAFAREVKASTSAAVSARLGRVKEAADDLAVALGNLTLTDHMIFGKAELPRFLNGTKYSGVRNVEQTIHDFVDVAADAIAIVDAEPKRGRPRAFAENALAQRIAELLRDELGERPQARRGSRFEKLLRLAFHHAGLQRDDVMDNMRTGLKQATIAQQQLQSVARRPGSGGVKGKKRT